MKKLILLLIIIGLYTNIASSQSIKMDTLLGKNGLFSKFKPKEVTNKQRLSFNVKMTISMKEKNGKNEEMYVFFNTKHGYYGLLNSDGKSSVFNPNDKDFNFMMFTHTMKSLVFTNDRKGNKTVVSLPVMPNKDEFKMEKVTLKKDGSTSKKFTNLGITGYPYNNSKNSAKDKVIVHLNDNSISGNYQYKNQLSFAGLGFYQINDKTVLSMCLESNGTIITLSKIEPVSIKFNASEFKKEEMEGMDKAMEEMMKNLKKQ